MPFGNYDGNRNMTVDSKEVARIASEGYKSDKASGGLDFQELVE
jgi:hypothetical protein